MKKLIILFSLVLLPLSLTAQIPSKRIEVEGRIISEANEVEGVTIFNTSINKGTITDSDGKFMINAGLNDRLEVSALQFEPFEITIDQQIMESGKLTVFMVERINKLNEIVILPFGLTGDLSADLNSVRTFNPDLQDLYFGVNDLGVYGYDDDYRPKADNFIMREGEYYNGVDLARIGKGLLAPLLRGDGDKAEGSYSYKALQDVYTKNFICESFNIPEDEYQEFLSYMASQDVDQSLYKQGKEMDLLEYISAQSQMFLKGKSGRN
ncbi:carboxypeptidase-like regulatory domain-containing protein [Mangrovimonas aestuarii]|uniref:carboxypeptidase-like regulatory domain-containing protein n=1 Tax=Mangrovimonas aestuarii TaxID=3018443 RepID=UPI002379867D|nr:carboxypeptidase-like regulatory domain-containing protein [Mangrovimonas aestuarii]